MLNYDDFMNQNSSSIKYSISEEEYNNLKMYVSNQIFSYIEYNNLKIDNISSLVDFTILQLLKMQSYNKIMNGNSETTIEYIVKQVYENSKSDIKIHKLTPLKVIMRFVYLTKSIIEPNIDFDNYCKDIYELLLYNGYTDEDILNGNASNELMLILATKTGGISYTPEFEEFRSKVEAETSTIFASNIMQIRREEKSNEALMRDVAYNCYNSEKFKKRIAFDAALIYYLDEDKMGALNYTELSNYIRKSIDKEIIKSNSAERKETINEIKCVFRTKDKSKEEKEQSEKIKKVIAIIVSLFILDNILYLIFKSFRDDENKNNKSKVEYNYDNTSSKNDDINKSFHNLSYDYENNDIVMEDSNNVKL